MMNMQFNDANFDYNKCFQMAVVNNEIITVSLPSEKKAIVLSEEAYLDLLQAKESLKNYGKLQERHKEAPDSLVERTLANVMDKYNDAFMELAK